MAPRGRTCPRRAWPARGDRRCKARRPQLVPRGRPGEAKKIEGVRAPSIHIHGSASYFLGYLLEGVGRGHLGERHETGAADPGGLADVPEEATQGLREESVH